MSFISLILLLIAVFIRPQDWMVGFYGAPLIFILSVATIIFLLIERLANKKIAIIKGPQNIFMLGLFFSVLMSHIMHTYLGGVIAAFNLFLVNVVGFFLLLNVINTERKFKITIWFLIVAIFILSLQGIYQAKYGYGWAGQPLYIKPDAPSGRITWIGIFNDPNDLSLTFVIAVSLLIAFLFQKGSILAKIVSMFFLGYLLYGIYLTNSRGGILALIVMLFFFFIKRSRWFIFGAITGVIFTSFIFIFGPSRMALMSTDEASAYSRIDLWYEGLQMMKSNPLFGIGYGMFMDFAPQTAHNSFVLAGAELGLIGLFFFMGLIYISFKQLSAIQKSQSALKVYAYGLQAGLIGFCAAAFFLSRTYIILPYMLFALSGSLFHIAQQKDNKLQFKFSKRDVRNVAVLSIGLLGFIYLIAKIGLS